MRRALFLLLALPASALAAPETPAPNTRVAVFTFQTDGSVERKYGIKNAGDTTAYVLGVDLAGLAPLAAIDCRNAQRRVDGQAILLPSPAAPADAGRIGGETGASILVDGRVYSADSNIIIAARVVSAKTGQTMGTMVKGDERQAFPDLVSQLAVQVAEIALAQQGAGPVTWPNAAIVGSCKRGAFLVSDEIACAMDVDGRLIPDETQHWNQEQVLLPGLHEVYVRYYDGHSTAGHSFVFDARTGAHYEIRFDRQPKKNPTLWIQDRDSQRPVTQEFAVELDADTTKFDAWFYGGGPFGIWSEQTGNPVVPSSPPGPSMKK